MSSKFDYVVVGAGAIGGSVAAQLVRAGHSVLLCDADREHVAAINERGLSIEGPLESFSVEAQAVTPENLPEELGAVLLAVKSQHTGAALDEILPRLRSDGFVVSLQNGINEPHIASRAGADRTVGAFVNFGADWLAPGRIFVGGRGALYVGELDGRETERIARLVRDLPAARASGNIIGFLWGKEAYSAMLFATAVSDVSIADALAEPRYRGVFVQLAREVLAAAPVVIEPFDGFDPSDLDASVDRLVEFNRRSAKTHSGIYRDLMVRKRRTEKTMFAGVEGPLLERTLELIAEIEEGRRTCEAANLELLAAYQRLQEHAPKLKASITELPPGPRAAAGPLHGVAVAVEDSVDIAEIVTRGASSVGTTPSARSDARIVTRLREAGADLLCKTNLLEDAAGDVNAAPGMTFDALAYIRTSGGSSSDLAALVAAGVCDYALGADRNGSIRVAATYRDIVGLKPTPGIVPLEGVLPLSPTCDHVGTLTRTVVQAAILLSVLAAREVELRPADGVRIGVLRRQLDGPGLRPEMRARVVDALEALARAGFNLVDIDLPELDLAEATLQPVVRREAWDRHRDRYEHQRLMFAPGTRALLEAGSRVTDAEYHAGLAGRDRLTAALARVFEDVALVAGPTVAYAVPPKDPPSASGGELETRYAALYNLAGMPAISLPCGLVRGSWPVGLQLAAASGEDALLLSVARVYDRLPGED